MSLPASVLITGASGNLGAKLAAHLAGRTRLVRLDRVAGDGIHPADLSTWGDWTRHFEGVQAVVHMAGNPVAYHDWPELLGPNVDAMLNVYEAAAVHGVRRVVFASSNHVMGGYQDGPPVPITESLPPKPGLRYTADGAERFSGAYAATKLLGERVGRQYAAARGLEVIAVRIGWVWRGVNEPDELPPERGDWFRNMWLSDQDFLHLMDCGLTAPLPEPFLIVNGMSANTGMRWDLTLARTLLGFSPRDDVHRTRPCRPQRGRQVRQPSTRIHTMKHTAALLSALLLAPLAAAGDDLIVYPPVPGLDASEHYKVRVRPAPKGEWKSAFAWVTACKTIEKKTDAYFDTLAGWTHTYVNFETAGAVEVEIARGNGRPIRSAAVHPKRKASDCVVKDGKAYVTLDKPALVAVDIDGQMDGQDTGKGYKGPPIHTISLFANPPLAGKPKPGDPGVFMVKPGQRPPADGKWTTLYFLPGVHDVGLAYPLRANCNYYIPGDALVYGTLSSTKWGDGHHIRIFGHGTLSGARLKHPEYADPPAKEKEHGRYRPIEVVGATDTRVEGVTIADSATHSLMLIHPYKEGHPNEVKWAKIFTWRANGDGINPFGNTLVEDCFLRTQDDSLYVNGLGIRRCVLWNDANGSSFVLTSVPQVGDRKLVVEDCDVIYSRAKWHHWSGGRVFSMRGEGKGGGGAGVTFRNITVEDPRPTLQQFFLCMTVPKPYSKEDRKCGAGDLSGIHFQNVTIAAPSVLGEPQMLWGQSDARIRNLTFKNLTVGGKPVRDATFFKSNDFVDGLTFEHDKDGKR